VVNKVSPTGCSDGLQLVAKRQSGKRRQKARGKGQEAKGKGQGARGKGGRARGKGQEARGKGGRAKYVVIRMMFLF